MESVGLSRRHRRHRAPGHGIASGPGQGRRLHPGAGAGGPQELRHRHRHLRWRAPPAAGGVHLPFSIQSISKVFTLTLALNKLGANLWERVGREPSGSRFNSIVQLEAEKGIPRNPLINAGAVVITDALLDGGDVDATIAEILGFMRRLADDPTIVIDDEVAESEAADRLSQRRPRQFPARQRQSEKHGRGRAAGLFQPVRHPHELPPAGARRPVPGQCRPRSARTMPASPRRSAPSASTP